MLMIRRRLTAAAVASAVVTLSCHNLESPTATTNSQLVVHGVMDTQTDEQTVLIYRSSTGAPLAVGAVNNEAPVLDASVDVLLPNGTRALARSNDDGSYGFVPRLGGVIVSEGGTYALHVVTAEGEEATGSTTVPLAPRVQFIILPNLMRARDTFRLSWPRVPNAHRYEVFVRTSGYRTFTDTAIAIPGTALTINGDAVFPLNMNADVFVSAVDVNYYEYYRAQSDPFAGAPPSNLSGAVGVFGAIAPILSVQFAVR